MISNRRTCALAGVSPDELSTQACARAILSRWGASENTFKHLGNKHPLHYQPGFEMVESEKLEDYSCFKRICNESKNLFDFATSSVWNARKQMVEWLLPFYENKNEYVDLFYAITSCQGWIKSEKHRGISKSTLNPLAAQSVGQPSIESYWTNALRPHRRKYYLQITDPDFFPKMEHIIEQYSNPPQNLYCFDECTGIQALKRLTPTLPPTADQPAL